MRLSWQPVSYWIPVFVPPRFKVSTKGTDWFALTLGTVTKWAWLLCMQALFFTGTPCYKHSLVHTLEVSFLRESLHFSLSAGETEVVVRDQLSRVSGKLSLPDPQYLLRENSIIIHMEQGLGGRVRRIRMLRFRFRGFLFDHFEPCLREWGPGHRDKEWIDNSSPICPQIGLGIRTWVKVGHCLDTVCGIWRTGHWKMASLP